MNCTICGQGIEGAAEGVPRPGEVVTATHAQCQYAYQCGSTTAKAKERQLVVYWIRRWVGDVDPIVIARMIEKGEHAGEVFGDCFPGSKMRMKP